MNIVGKEIHTEREIEEQSVLLAEDADEDRQRNCDVRKAADQRSTSAAGIMKRWSRVAVLRAKED